MGLLKWGNEFGREALDVFRSKEAERAKGLIDRAVKDKYGPDSTFNLLTYPGGAFTQSVFNHAKQNLPKAMDAKAHRAGFQSILKKASDVPGVNAPTTKNEWKRVGSKSMKAANYSSNMGTGAWSSLLGETKAETDAEGKKHLKTRFGLDTINPLSIKKNLESAESANAEVYGGGSGSLNSPRAVLRQLQHMGGEGFAESNLPEGAKVAGSIGLDPVTAVPAAWPVKGLKALPWVGKSIGVAAEHPGLTGKAIRGAAELAAGFDSPKGAIGFAAGAGALAEGIQHAPIPERAKPIANVVGILGGGLLGMKAANAKLPSPTSISGGGIKRGAGGILAQEAPVSSFSGEQTIEGAGSVAERLGKGENPLVVPTKEAEARTRNILKRRNNLADPADKFSYPGRPVNPERTFTNAQGQSVTVGRPGDETWKARVNRHLDDEGLVEARTWYHTLVDQFEARYGIEEGRRRFISFMLANQGDSPTGGLRNTVRGVDLEQKGLPPLWGGAGKLGLADENIRAILKDISTDKGFDAKLSDFVDSGLRRKTRTIAGDAPEAGRPAVIDVWGGRDAGFVDIPTQNDIRAMFGDEAADSLIVDFKGSKTSTSGKPTESQYEWASHWYNDLTDKLDAEKFRGHSWEDPFEVQAVGWYAVQKELGKNPESMLDAFANNTRQLQNVPKAFDSIIPRLEEITGHRITRVEDGDQGHWDILGSKEAAEDIAHAAVALTGEPAHLTRTLPSGKVEKITVKPEDFDDPIAALRERGRNDLADALDTDIRQAFERGLIGTGGSPASPAELAPAKPSLIGRAKSAAGSLLAGETPTARITTNAQPGETLLHGTTREFEGLPTEGYSHVTGENAPHYTRRPDVVEQFSTARGPNGRVIEATPSREMSFLDTQGPVTSEEMGDIVAAAERVLGDAGDEVYRLSQTSDPVSGYELLGALRQQVGENPGKISEILREAGFDGIDGETLAEGFTSAGMQVTNQEPGLLSRLGAKALGSEAPRPGITEEISPDTILHHGTAREFEGLPTGDKTRVNAIGAKGPYYTRDAEAAARRAKENVAFGENKPRVIEAQPERPLKAVKYDQPLTRAEAEVLDDALYDATGYYQSLSPAARKQWDAAISIAHAAPSGMKFSKLLSILKGELDEDQITALLRKSGWDAVDAEGGSDALMGVQILDEGAGPMRPRSILDQAAGGGPVASVGERRARMAGGGSLGKDWVRMGVDEIGEALGKDVSTVREALALERQGLLDKEAIGALQLMRKEWAAEYVAKYGGQPVRAYKAGTRAARYQAIDDIAAARNIDPDAIPAGAYPAQQSERGRRALEEILEVPAPHERIPEAGAAGGVAGVGDKGNIASILTGTYFGKTPAQIAARGAFGAVQSELDDNEETNWATGLASGLVPGAASRVGLRAAARANKRGAEEAVSDTLLGVKGGMGEKGKQQFEESLSKPSGKDPTGGLLTPPPEPKPRVPMTPEEVAARSAKAAATRAAKAAEAGPPAPKTIAPKAAKPAAPKETVKPRAPAAQPPGTPPTPGTIDAKRDDALKQMGKEPNVAAGAVNALSTAADTIRTVTTVGDLGVPLVQGWNMLTNPRTIGAWGRGVARGIRSSLDPEGIEKSTERGMKRLEDAAPGQNIVERAKTAGLQLASPGQNKFARTGDIGGEGGVALEKIPLGVGKFFKMNRTQFEVMSTEWRTSRLADLLSGQIARNVAKGEGEAVTDKQLADLVKVSNHATGTIGPSSGMASPVANALFFAPRFLSSQFALIGDAFHGGMRGSVAREHLAWGLAEVTGLTLAYNWATTGEPFGPGTGDPQHAVQNWDETIKNPNFMKFKVGDAKLSAYGPLDSLGRMFAKEMGTAYQVAQGDASAKDLADAPLAYARGKLSPAAGLGVDLIKGEDAVGKVMTTENVLTRALPITGQNIMAALRGEGEWGSVAAEYFGFKSTGVTDSDRLKDALRSTDDKRLWVTDAETGEKRPPESIGEVPRDKRAILQETMPEYKAWMKSKDAGREIAPDRIASDANKAAQAKDDNLLNNGGDDAITRAQWRDRYVNGQKRARAQEEALRGDKKYPDPKTQEGKDVQKYFELYDRPDIQNPDGSVDGEAFQIALDALRSEVGEERWKKLDATVSYNDSATVREYKADMRAYGEFLDNNPKYKGVSVEDTREVDRIASRVRAVAATLGYTQKSVIAAVIKEEGYDPALKALVTQALARGYSPQYEKWRKSEEGQKSMRWFSNARVDDAARYAGKGVPSDSGGSSSTSSTRSSTSARGASGRGASAPRGASGRGASSR